MQARLVQIEGKRRLRSTAVGESDARIGRDPTSEVIVDFARVSRHHAVIRALGDRHTIADLGSTNGTTVNGLPVGEAPELLESGDVIELGGEVALLYETGPFRSATPWIAAAGTMVVLALGLGLFNWWQLRSHDPVLDTATRHARQGYAAAQEGDLEEAKQALRRAAGVLFRAGHLDDVSRGDVMRVALEQLSAEVGEDADLWAVFEASLAAAQPLPGAVPRAAPAEPAPAGTAPGVPEPGPGRAEPADGLASAPAPSAPAAAAAVTASPPTADCRLDRVASDHLRDCIHERIELVMLGLRQDPSNLPPGFTDDVGARILHEYDGIRDSLERGEALVPMLEEELMQARMPRLLHYLALVESGYDPRARSPAGAAGLWQFMPGTARQYGLRVSGATDERHDPVKSTRAASRYLRDLAFEFGGDALLLALSSYNRGENGVRRALKRLDDPFSDRSYWRLVDEGLLPTETSNYVTRYVAAAVSGEAGLPEREALVDAGF